MQKNTKYLQKNLHISKKCSTFAPAFQKLESSGSPKILIFVGEEVPRMVLRVLATTHRTSEAQVARLYSGVV